MVTKLTILFLPCYQEIPKTKKTTKLTRLPLCPMHNCLSPGTTGFSDSWHFPDTEASTSTFHLPPLRRHKVKSQTIPTSGIPQSQYNFHQTQEDINAFISHIYTVAFSSSVVARAHFSINCAHWLYSNTGSSQDSITNPTREKNLHLAAEGTDSVTDQDSQAGKFISVL